MPVPDFQSLILPALKAFARGEELSRPEIRERVADAERLSEEDLREMLPSGRQPVFANRVSWAVTYITRAGLVECVRRGVYRITDEGRQLLSDPPPRIDSRLLKKRYPSFTKPKPNGETTQQDRRKNGTDTPEEALEHAWKELSGALEIDVLQRVRDAKPEFLERTVVDLLMAMGFGSGEVQGGSGDGGIDGAIREDALGLDEVYVQAKKYAEGNTVGERDLRDFAGAIDAANTTKGIFVTTSGFTRAAKDYVVRSPKRIALIDGEKLARLMVRHGVGVRTRLNIKVKRIDEDYFDQDAP